MLTFSLNFNLKKKQAFYTKGITFANKQSTYELLRQTNTSKSIVDAFLVS
jgi:hypothetical protein